MATTEQLTPIGSTGMELRDGLPFEEWVGLGRRLGKMGSALCWAIGDWVDFGQAEYGKKYEAALEVTGLDYQTLRNYQSISGRYDLSRRRDNLSFGHHAEVTALDDDVQDRWLDAAVELGWSRNRLREELRKELAAPEPRAALDVARVTLTYPPERVDRWKAAAAGAEMELVDWVAEQLDRAAA